MLTSIFIKRILTPKVLNESFHTVSEKCIQYRSVSMIHVLCTIRRSISRVRYVAFSQNITVRYKTTLQEVDTNVLNNVILFKHENPKYFRNINIFAVAQLFAWSVLSYALYIPEMMDALLSKNWDECMHLYAFHLGLIVFGMITGPSMFAIIWAFTKRSVKYIILHKGGTEISIVTYYPFKQHHILTVPLKQILKARSRTDAGLYLPIKVKGHRLFYILDKSGEFLNPILFDYTVGLDRSKKTK